MATFAPARSAFNPAIPQNFQELGVPESLVLDLVIRRLLIEGYSSLASLSRSTHDIWYVWAPGYQTYHTKCDQIEIDLQQDPSFTVHEIFPFTQVLNSDVVYEDMELVQFVPVHS